MPKIFKPKNKRNIVAENVLIFKFPGWTILFWVDHFGLLDRPRLIKNTINLIRNILLHLIQN